MKKLEYYEDGKIQSKQIVSNISNTLKQLNWQISELKKSKKRTDELIKKFDINCYKYNLVDEMILSKERLEQNIKKILNKLNYINSNNSNNPQLMIKKVDYINDILNNSELQLKSVNKEKLDEIEKLQLNAIKKGIYDKFMLIKSEIDRDKIKEKFDKRRGTSYFRKLINKFFEIEEKPDSKKENLFMQIHEIDKVREEILKNKEPAREYRIVEILAEIEIYLSENEFDNNYQDQLRKIKELKQNINTAFSIDNQKLKQEVLNKKQVRLLATSKKQSKATKERQKTIEFLTKNGYIVNGESNPIKSRMITVIKKINTISESIEKVLKI